MSRLARVVVPGLPHLVTQRGNRGEPIFFERGDQEVYRDLLAAQLRRVRVAVWAYCLMPNHVHLIVVPSDQNGLSRAIGEAHRRYTSFINTRRGCIGHLFQSRFASVVFDDTYLGAAMRYVNLNPVRAGFVQHAEDWRWSSARRYICGDDDGLIATGSMLEKLGAARAIRTSGQSDNQAFVNLRSAERTGRPLGTPLFIAHLERIIGRRVTPRTPGRKPRAYAEQIGE